MRINNKKIGRNEPCVCGSAVKFKKCCMKTVTGYTADILNNITNNINEKEIKKAIKADKEISKMGKYKECLHKHKGDCEGKIVNAHTIQNNGVIKGISDKGIVYMPLKDTNQNFPGKYGRKQATVFTGFCGKHDKELFRVIEDIEFKGTEEQIFMLTYRTIASELYTMKVTSDRRVEFVLGGKYDEIFKNDYNILESKNYYDAFYEAYKENILQSADVKKSGYEDLLKTKEKMDKMINDRNFKGVKYEYRYYEEEIKFSGSIFAGQEFDIQGKRIQSLTDTEFESMVYNVLYKDGKTHIVVSWLGEEGSKFDELGEQISKMGDNELKQYVSNIMLMYGEKIVITPTAYDRLSKDKKDKFKEICYMCHFNPCKYLSYKTPLSDLGFNLFEL